MYVLSMTHLLSLAVVSKVVCQSHWQESEEGEWTVSGSTRIQAGLVLLSVQVPCGIQLALLRPA